MELRLQATAVAEALDEAHHVSSRIGAELAHDTSALGLDGSLRGPEFSGDLLVEHPLGEKQTNLPLSPPQGLEEFPIPLQRALRDMCVMRAAQSGIDGDDQGRSVLR
jgi:hypothetical protein